MLNILCETSLTAECPIPGRGLASDGCWLYLTKFREYAVEKLTPAGELLKCYPTHRPYSCLCYDPKDRCFWASCEQCPYTLFKLNSFFQEIDHLYLHFCKTGQVTGIALQRCSNRLLVSLSFGLALIDKTGRMLMEQRKCDGRQGVLSLCPDAISWSWDTKRTMIQLINSKLEIVRFCSFPNADRVEGAVLEPGSSQCGPCVICFLVTRRGKYPYLLHCALAQACIRQPRCPCNFLPCCNGEEIDSDGLDDFICSFPGTLDCSTESIAQTETSLSHILNDEGEKLQKSIASTANVQTLLAINKSVRDTLICTTHLEQTLFQKLSEFKRR